MNLDNLLKPHSIAIVGASQTPSASTNMIRSLERMRFEGDVNPLAVHEEGKGCVAADALNVGRQGFDGL